MNPSPKHSYAHHKPHKVHNPEIKGTEQKKKVLLEVKNLSTAHKKFKVSHISFTLKEGDILGLVGRSGSGKSTVLNTIVGLKRPIKGSVKTSIKGNKCKLDEVIGLSPQENSLYPFLTIKENIKIFSQLHKIKKKVMEKRAKTLLARLGLKDSGNKKIIQLSGGMRKRADLAVTLIHSPAIIILDEPFAGLDVTLTKFIWDLLKELSSQGKIIIISSHLLGNMEKNCNQFALILNGRFYNDDALRTAMTASLTRNLEQYLEALFRKDMEGN
ncbi:ABC transporter ATP-binding protein [Candidatus Woesearchaeota archaeon]|nr:ABC transporter ATP-binding protein [Candidatus Woesearchaeota archaeon]